MPLNDPSEDRRVTDMMNRLQATMVPGKPVEFLPAALRQAATPPGELNIATHIHCTCGLYIRHEGAAEVVCQRCGLLWLWDPDQECWYMGMAEPTDAQLAELDRRAQQAATGGGKD